MSLHERLDICLQRLRQIAERRQHGGIRWEEAEAIVKHIDAMDAALAQANKLFPIQIRRDAIG